MECDATTDRPEGVTTAVLYHGNREILEIIDTRECGVQDREANASRLLVLLTGVYQESFSI